MKPWRITKIAEVRTGSVRITMRRRKRDGVIVWIGTSESAYYRGPDGQYYWVYKKDLGELGL